jgi:hypothetical protein
MDNRDAHHHMGYHNHHVDNYNLCHFKDKAVTGMKGFSFQAASSNRCIFELAGESIKEVV